MQSQKKIQLFVSALNCGGTERIALNLLQHLPKSYNPELVILYNKIEQYPEKIERYIMPFYSHQMLRILLFPYGVMRYIIYSISSKADVVISMDGPTNIINLLSSIFGHKCIISYHVMPSLNNNIVAKFSHKLNSILLKITNKDVVVVSEGLKHELMERYNNQQLKIHVLHNPIDVETVRRLSLSNENDSENIFSPSNHQQYIVTVARLSKEKGLHHLIRAFSKSSLANNLNLVIVGDGIERPYLEDLAKKSTPHPENIIFAGYKDTPYPYIRNARLFVQSSLSEALPNVLVEAMACGCPIVAANCSPGIGEIMGSDNSCGFITKKMSGIRHTANEPLDEGELDLLEAIEKILDDAELRERMSIACKMRAKLFDLDVGIQKYVELIEKIGTR